MNYGDLNNFCCIKLCSSDKFIYLLLKNICYLCIMKKLDNIQNNVCQYKI